MELGLASGHLSVAGAELANKVVAEKEILITNTKCIKKKHNGFARFKKQLIPVSKTVNNNL